MSLQRIIDGLRAFVRHELSALLYHTPWPARVVAQAADGTLEVQPDDPRIPGLTGVPLRLGLPGATVTVPADTRVLVGFEAGDPRRPIAELWETGSTAGATPLTINLPATSKIRFGTAGFVGVARLDDRTDVGTLAFASPNATTIVITYTPPIGVPQAVTLTLNGAGGVLALVGKIITASSRVETE